MINMGISKSDLDYIENGQRYEIVTNRPVGPVNEIIEVLNRIDKRLEKLTEIVHNISVDTL